MKLEQAIAINRQDFDKNLYKWKKKLSNPESWDDFISDILNKIYDRRSWEAYIESVRGDQELIASQIKAVNAIRNNLSKLNGTTIDEIWEVFDDDDDPGPLEHKRDIRLCRHEAFIEQCNAWREAQEPDIRARKNFYPKLLVEDLINIYSLYLSIEPAMMSISDFSDLCDSVFKFCYKGRYTSETLGDWADSIIKQKK